VTAADTAAATPSGVAAPAGVPEFEDAELLGEFEPGSPEWHQARATGLGGSEMAAVLGLTDWESAYALWHRKQGLLPPVKQTRQMLWGHLLEDDIVEIAGLEHPELEFLPAGTYRNRERPWQIANPDRFAAGPDGLIGVEVKSIRQLDDDWGPAGSPIIPVYYRTQVLHYMDTLGLRRFLVAVGVAGCDYRPYWIDWDERDALLMREAGAAFIASIAAGEPPELDGHEQTYRAVSALTTGRVDDAVEIPPKLAAEYRAAITAAKAADEAKRLASARVLAAIGSHRRAECNGQPVATRAVKADGSTHSLQPKGL
jgi:putative phage-type endonuclease